MITEIFTDKRMRESLTGFGLNNLDTYFDYLQKNAEIEFKSWLEIHYIMLIHERTGMILRTSLGIPKELLK